MRVIRLMVLGLFLIAWAGLARAESAVWTVRGSNATLYLAGSCHALRAADYPLPPEFAAAYRQAARLVFETPLAELQAPATQLKMLQLGVYADGSTLKQHLSPEAFAKAEAYCKKQNIPLEKFMPLQPWMFIVTLTMLELQKMGIQPTHGVEYFFDARAKKDRKPIEGLETADEQLGFMTLMGKGLDNEMIFKEIDDLEQIRTELPALIAAWKKGDEQALEINFIPKFKADYPKLYQALLVERNQKWVKKIEAYLNKPERVMVIVGAAHLAGPDSVVQMLRQRGYQVEKFTAPADPAPKTGE
jgi:uncharacterized protein YbaP (TraB family)